MSIVSFTITRAETAFGGAYAVYEIVLHERGEEITITGTGSLPRYTRRQIPEGDQEPPKGS